MRGGWLVCSFAAVAAVSLVPDTAHAIPVFARVYGKPCSACHTVFLLLNPAGEAFRARGLHGIPPVVKPIKIVPGGLDLPGTLPVAASLAAGEDVTSVKVTGSEGSTLSHFNLNYLALLAGGEIGPYMAALFDFAPLFAIPRTGDLFENKRMGLGFLQAHADAADWLINLRGGLFELPLGTSPRVHRLSAQSYLLYQVNAFSLLGLRPPVDKRSDSLSLASTQYGAELSGLQDAETTANWAVGFTSGSNNRSDNNDAMDVFGRLGVNWGLHRAGFFVYYSPDTLSAGVHDPAWRFGPDAQLYYRQVTVRAQLLAGKDSNPTGSHRDFWYYGGFIEGDYRVLANLAALGRFEYVGTPNFNDSKDNGPHVERDVLQVTGGLQWLVLENVKVVLETTYGENRDSVSDRKAKTWAGTIRVASAFWVPVPAAMEEWLGGLT